MALPKVAAAATALLLASSASLASAQNNGTTSANITVTLPSGTYPIQDPASRWLTVDEWAAFLNSDAATEFEYDPNSQEVEKARNLWDEAVKFEWGRCAVEETLKTARKCTYVFCHASKEGSGATLSGAKRKKAMFGDLNVELNNTVLTTIYSTDEVWCGYGQLPTSAALGVNCGDTDNDGDYECVVTPLHMSMKFMPETLGLLLESIEELYGESNLTKLEDGSPERRRRKLERQAKEAEEAERRRLRRGLKDDDVAIGRKDNVVGSGGNATEAELEGGPGSRPIPKIEELPAAEFYLAPGSVDTTDMAGFGADPDADAANLDVTGFMTEWLLSKTNNVGNETTSVGAENNYWTSSRAAKVDEEATGRARFWRDVFELVHKTDRCDTTYSTKLQWTANLSTDDFSVLTAKYNETAGGEPDEGEKLLDQWCIVALIASLATYPDVVAAEIKPRLGPKNVNAAWLTQSGLENRFQWFDNGLDGTGQIVAVSDTGIDPNNCYFWDNEKGLQYDVLDESRRKIAEYIPFVNEDDYTFGHGTHVAGTIVGQRATDGITESKGSADGVAKGAKVAFMDIGTDNGGLILPSSNNYLLSTGRTGANRDDWAHVHSASWGSVGVNYYSGQARAFDDYMFRNTDFLINVAAGNDGRNDARNTVSSPATFKNGLSVGCAHSTGDDLADGQLGPSYMADFSSKGPTADGRMNPMIVAPGKYILSAGAQPGQTGECDDGVPSAGNGRAGLKSMAGTSMATPVVSANVALIWQYFREGYYPSGRPNAADAMSPTAALVKAVLMNGAQTDMRGTDNGRGNVSPVAPYDNVIGFGRVSLVRSLYLEGWSDVGAKVWDDQLILDGDTFEQNVTIDKSNGCTWNSISVSLVWVERPSVIGCSRCVLNDLNLRLVDPAGKTHYPNGRTSPDDKNNAERVVLGGAADGTNYTIVVEGYNMDSASQRYALVATGCFGGVANTLDTSQDAFVTDDSADRRTRNIIITVCSIFGALLVFGIGCWWCRRRKDDGGDGAAAAAAASAPVAESVKKVSSSSEEERAAPQNEEEIEVEAAKDDDDKDHSA
eukprot:CAMPEP_0197434832 /NCGR_PEP_ID=MMETSP1175-20131217/2507_1 /TAXON_ID=1003142 /ORGANISM="Triceratium dubium, Strain CCMP147" /LENGTH=1062 /DNA_ID=CAMNT_0042963687 /DNA_START=391 /DNA_END=3579 /DNA_ORIENTATION=+